MLYKQFAELFRRSETLDYNEPFGNFLAGNPRLLAREVECCKRLTTTDKVMRYFPSAPETDGLLKESFKSMPGLFVHLVASVYARWWQNGRIP